MNATFIKYLTGFLDVLMLLVPFLELTEVISVIPLEYLPVYMLVVTLTRRGIRIIQEYLAKKKVG